HLRTRAGWSDQEPARRRQSEVRFGLGGPGRCRRSCLDNNRRRTYPAAGVFVGGLSFVARQSGPTTGPLRALMRAKAESSISGSQSRFRTFEATCRLPRQLVKRPDQFAHSLKLVRPLKPFLGNRRLRLGLAETQSQSDFS